MAKMTLADLKKLRESKQQAMSERDPSNKVTQVIVGMGTCGIAAGAKDTFNAFLDELEKNNITTMLLRQTGCMGACASEPTVEVIAPDMPVVIYGKVNGDIGRQIVREHIIGKKLIDNHIVDRPALDIMK